MAPLLHKVQPNATMADGALRTLTLDVGRTLALVLLGVLALGAALALYLTDRTGAAGAFFALGEAIVVGGLGIVVGEKAGSS